MIAAYRMISWGLTLKQPKRSLERRLRSLLKARPKPTSEKKPRDWLTTSIAILALTVSAGTFYLSNLRKFDELTAVISQAPSFTLEDPALKAGDKITATLINSGNRPLAVQKLKIQFKELIHLAGHTRYPVDQIVRTNCEGEYSSFGLDFEPIVIKPSEIEVVHAVVSLRDPFDLSPSHGPNRYRSFQFCMSYYVVLSDGTVDETSHPVFAVDVSRDADGKVAEIQTALPINALTVVRINDVNCGAEFEPAIRCAPCARPNSCRARSRRWRRRSSPPDRPS
jgi:hypothetical protein